MHLTTGHNLIFEPLVVFPVPLHVMVADPKYTFIMLSTMMAKTMLNTKRVMWKKKKKKKKKHF